MERSEFESILLKYKSHNQFRRAVKLSNDAFKKMVNTPNGVLAHETTVRIRSLSKGREQISEEQRLPQRLSKNKKECLKAMALVYEKTGYLKISDLKNNNLPSYLKIKNLCGSWENALKAAGIPLNRAGRR